MLHPNSATRTRATRCKTCDGHGVTYMGDPAAIGTPTETCTKCNGTGRQATK